TLAYGAAQNFEQKLSETDIYVWLPAGPRAATPADQALLLGQWLDSGRGRQIHFHWGDGTRAADGITATHSAEYDRVYLQALDIDYAALDRQMDATINRLRAGEVRVTTPAGTDIRFRVGDRPFCKQNGDASKARMQNARIRIDREIELPAGALRVAPLEESVNGVMVVPQARIGNVEVKGLRFEFTGGVMTKYSAASNEDALRRYLESSAALKHFREFALGLNPRLMTPRGKQWVPYYGYGAGAVRLGLGDNSELGGAVRGGAVRWLFFMDATVTVGRDALVRKGRLVSQP
ncbi:MAG: aminopeptidase, partial [Acidobacteriota bacterium]